jgi:hypothetical protein
MDEGKEKKKVKMKLAVKVYTVLYLSLKTTMLKNGFDVNSV